MATPVFCCGFECGGPIGSAGLGHLGNDNSATISTTTVRTGLRSLRCNPSATVQGNAVTLTATNYFVGRIYIRFATLPNATVELFYMLFSAANCGVYFKSTDNSIYAGRGTANLGATGIPVTTGVWYCLDVKVDAHTNPWTIDVQVDGVACGQVTNAVAANTGNVVSYGNGTTSCAADYFFDDCIVSQTPGDYPLGPGLVQSFVPNADGTHTFTTTIGVRGTVAAQTGGGNIAGSTDSYQWLNARPIGGGVADSTRLWNQQSNAATLYGEVQFEDWSLPGGGVNGPRAVEVLIIRRDAATGTGDAAFKLNDNGTEDTIFSFTGAAGVASDQPQTKQYATMVGGGAWTLARFNGLRFRFGYSSDANPDHFVRGVMIEAEFQPELGQALYAPPFGLIGRSQMAQLLAT